MQLEATGERVVEDLYFSNPERYLIYLFHVVTYDFAAQYVSNKVVLDYGCGSGYGTHRMSEYCSSIVGVDISQEAVEFARKRYTNDTLEYLQIPPAETAPLPFEDASFDTVLSFQVIEHLHDTKAYLTEIYRVLKPGGMFICATPDRSTRLLHSQKPWNVWHVREYNSDTFQTLLESRFDSVEVLKMGGKKEVIASEIRRTNRLKWLTLPATLPFIPEKLRVFALNLIKKSFKAEKSTGEKKLNFGFGPEDLYISADASPSVNLVALARRS